MPKLVTSIVRNPDGLKARICGSCGIFRFPGLSDEPLGIEYFSHDVALIDARPHVVSHQLLLEQSFAALANASPNSLQTFERVLTLVLLTVPQVHRVDQQPVLKTPPQAAPRLRTAAHTRGFRGTRYQPPKSASVAKVDLRAAACSRKQSREILATGWQFRHRVVPDLASKLGLPAAGSRRLTEPTVPRDPFIAAWFPQAPAEPNLDTGFVENLLWCCRSLPWKQVAALYGTYQRLRLRHDEQLQTIVARLLASYPGSQTVDWILTIESQAPEQRSAFATLIVESQVVEQGRPPELLARALLEHCPPNRYHRWAALALQTVSQSAEPAYLAAGFRLAAAYEPDHYFYNVADCKGFRQQPLDQILHHPSPQQAAELAMPLWQAVGHIPGLMRHLQTLPVARFSSAALSAYLRFMCLLRNHTARTKMTVEDWREVEVCLPALRRMLCAIPTEYLNQATHTVATLLDAWHRAEEIASCLPKAIECVGRLQTPPLAPRGNLSGVLAVFFGVEDPALRQRLLNAPLATYAQLDRACRRANRSLLISWGLRTLLDTHADLVEATLAKESRALLRIASHLGTTNWQVRQRILQSWSPSISIRDLQELPLRTLIEQLDSMLPSSGLNIIPRALRDGSRGARQLSDGQIERHRRRLTAALPRLHLAQLDRHVDARLGSSIGVDQPSPELRFAIGLLHDAESNRRSFRRFLRAYIQGDKDYLSRHPATLQWYRRNPRIDPELWTTGVQTTVASPAGERVTVALERDPIEILKLGQYVGSCLGLGGVLSSSAIAALLDVNKQVVYVRDAHGAVLARQLLAISDQQQMIAFAVYPKSPEWLVRAFHDHACLFSERLDIEICTQDDYAVDIVIAEDWWDDGLLEVTSE